MSQEPDAPKEQWEERDTSPSGRAMRKLIGEVIELRHSTVKQSHLNKLLGAAAVTIITGSWAVVKADIARGDRITESRLSEVNTTLRDQQNQINEVRAVVPQIRGTYRVSVEQQNRKTVAEEVRAQSVDGGGK